MSTATIDRTKVARLFLVWGKTSAIYGDKFVKLPPIFKQVSEDAFDEMMNLNFRWYSDWWVLNNHRYKDIKGTDSRLFRECMARFLEELHSNKIDHEMAG